MIRKTAYILAIAITIGGLLFCAMTLVAGIAEYSFLYVLFSIVFFSTLLFACYHFISSIFKANYQVNENNKIEEEYKKELERCLKNSIICVLSGIALGLIMFCAFIVIYI